MEQILFWMTMWPLIRGFIQSVLGTLLFWLVKSGIDELPEVRDKTANAQESWGFLNIHFLANWCAQKLFCKKQKQTP